MINQSMQKRDLHLLMTETGIHTLPITIEPECQLITTFEPNKRYVYYYLITNLITVMQYTGSRLINGKYPFEDTYMGSCDTLDEDMWKYGLHNFTKTILKHELFVNSKTTLLQEGYYVKKYDTLFPNGYNKHDPAKYHGYSRSGTTWSGEHKDIFSILMTELWNDRNFNIKRFIIEQEQHYKEVRLKNGWELNSPKFIRYVNTCKSLNKYQNIINSLNLENEGNKRTVNPESHIQIRKQRYQANKFDKIYDQSMIL